MASIEQAPLWHHQGRHCRDSPFTEKLRGAQGAGGISLCYQSCTTKHRKWGSPSRHPHKGHIFTSFTPIAGILSTEMPSYSWGQHLLTMRPCQPLRGPPKNTRSLFLGSKVLGSEKKLGRWCCGDGNRVGAKVMLRPLPPAG